MVVNQQKNPTVFFLLIRGSLVQVQEGEQDEKPFEIERLFFVKCKIIYPYSGTKTSIFYRSFRQPLAFFAYVLIRKTRSFAYVLTQKNKIYAPTLKHFLCLCKNLVNMFSRNAITLLRKWAEKENRKPLVLRGARQVGKTTLVNEFSKDLDT